MEKLSSTLKWMYSTRAFLALFALVVVYGIIFGLLWGLQAQGEVTFTKDVQGDVLKTVTTLPLVAVWILILLGATAGFARSALMTKFLPFKQALANKTVDSASIMLKIRCDTTAKKDDSLAKVLNKLLVARLPILAVVDDKNSVIGVITYQDVVKKMQAEYEKSQDLNDSSLTHKLDALKVSDIIDLDSASPVLVKESADLKSTLDIMIRYRFHKLIVVKDDQKNTYSGTIDIRDIVGEILESSPEEN
jgi:CBS domain-containing protein